MERVIVAAVLIAAAVAVAVVLGRRRPDAPTQDRVAVPRQLDRGDFVSPGSPWLVVAFTSDTCESCARATAMAGVLEAADVAYQEVPWQRGRELHDRYGVTDVPLIVIADAQGVVHRAFVGSPSLEALLDGLAEARRPGSTPDPDAGRIWTDES